MKKILLVGGQGAPFDQLAALLQQDGVEVDSTADIPPLLKKVKNTPPDLMIVDIFSPHINGAALLESIHKDPFAKSVPLIVLSAPQGIDLITGQSSLVKNYLTKPIDFAQLQKTLQEAVGVADHKFMPKVLIVDDDAEILELVSMFLEHHHYSPISLSQGNRVGEIARKEKPALILLDLSLPGLDGFAVLEQLKRDPSTTSIPVVVMSAIHLNTFQEAGLLSGQPELVAKDIPMDFLMNLIRTRLAETKSPPAAPAQPPGPKILVADDQQALLNLMKMVLEESGFNVLTASDGQEALDKIQENSPDIAVLDLEMPIKTGLEVCQELKKDPVLASIPVIILTGISEKKTMLKGLGLGIDEYLLKPIDTDELVARIQMVLNRNRQVLDANPLTHLPGNPSIQSRVEGLLETDAPIAVLYADLNQFKAYNDTYGFEAGDRVIRATGILLVQLAREIDGDQAFVGHIGGDDFIVVTHPDHMEIFCQKIIKKFSEIILPFYKEEDRQLGY
ncbi:MAG: response regulator, partial [Elusimicrobia bacterium]|nr:response regulator [Elusimicrobiota bacterium]